MMRATALVVFVLLLQSVSAELESEWGPGTYDNKSLGKIRRLLKTRGLQNKGTVGSSSAPKMSKSNSSSAPRMSKSNSSSAPRMSKSNSSSAPRMSKSTR
jgi:hypothetical protein